MNKTFPWYHRFGRLDFVTCSGKWPEKRKIGQKPVKLHDISTRIQLTVWYLWNMRNSRRCKSFLIMIWAVKKTISTQWKIYLGNNSLWLPEAGRVSIIPRELLSAEQKLESGSVKEELVENFSEKETARIFGFISYIQSLKRWNSIVLSEIWKRLSGMKITYKMELWAFCSCKSDH